MGRNWLVERIDSALKDPGCRIVLVTGQPGAGKSTLLAWLARARPEWLRYFVRRGGEREGGAYRHEGSLTEFLTAVGQQLLSLQPDLFPDIAANVEVNVGQRVDHLEAEGRATGLRIGELIGHPFRRLALTVRQDVGRAEGEVAAVEIRRFIDVVDPDALAGHALLDPARALLRLRPGERIVVLVDGLDELPFREAGLDVGKWLAGSAELPANVRFVVTSRYDDVRLDELRATQASWLQEVAIDPHSTEVRTDTERFASVIAADPVIEAALTSHHVTSERFVRTAVDRAAGNFQYLAFLARTLEAAGPAEPATTVADVEWLSELHDLPRGLDGLYALFLVRVRAQVVAGPATASRWAATYQPLLGLLAVAQAPLAPRQLEAFGSLPTAPESSESALRRLRQFLDRDENGAYRLYHASLADFLLAEATARTHPYLHCRSDEANGRIVAYASRRHGGDGSWRAADPYLRMHVAVHAAATGQLDELIEDPRFLIGVEPSGLVEVLGRARAAAPLTRLYRQALLTQSSADADEGDVLAHLELYARQARMGAFADRVAAVEDRRAWVPEWTHGKPPAVRQVLGRHDGDVTAIAVTRLKGRPVAVSGGEDGTLRLWDLTSGEAAGLLHHGFAADRSRGVTALAAGESDDGDAIVVSGGSDGTIQAWNVEDRRRLGAPLAGFESAGQGIGVSALDGVPVAVCRVGDSVRVWDLLARVPLGPPVLARNPELAVIGRHPAGALLVVGEKAGPGAGSVRAWDVVTGEPVGGELRPEEGWINSLAASGPLVALGDGAHGVQLWDALTGEPRSRRVHLWVRNLPALALGAVNGRSVVHVGDGEDGVRRWDLATGAWGAESFAAHPRGYATAIAQGDACGRAWFASAGREPQEIDAGVHRLRPVLRCWVSDAPMRAEALRQVGPVIPLDSEVRSVAVAEVDGRPVVMTASSDHVIRLWDPHTGKLAAPPCGGGADEVCALATVRLAGGLGVVAVAGRTVRGWPVTATDRGGAALAEVGECVATGVGQLDGRLIAVCGTWRAGARAWDIESGRPAGFAAVDEPEYVHAMAVGELRGRSVVAFGARTVVLKDLASGSEVGPSHPGHRGQVMALAFAVYRGRSVLVSGASDGTLRLWDPDAGSETGHLPGAEDPGEVPLADDIRTLAAAEVDGGLVAICGGRSGVIRTVDLTTDRADWLDGSSVIDVAIGSVGDRVVAVCADENGVHVLDVVTGQRAAPAPAFEVAGRPAAVAVGELDGRQVGLCAVASAVRAWYLDTGEPTWMAPIAHEGASCVGVGMFRGRPVVVSGGRDHTVWVADLRTGELVCNPISELQSPVAGVGIAAVANGDVLVYVRDGDVRARYLWTPEEDQEHAREREEYIDRLRRGDGPRTVDFAAVNETPPAFPRVGKRLTGHGHQLVADLGELHGAPIVASGHGDGSIYLFTVETALPIGHPFDLKPGRVTAIACGRLHGRPALAAGGADGTVRVWDLASGSALATIRTLARVRKLALAPPDHCVIGTELGLISVRVESADPDSPALVTLPLDVRGASRCPIHAPSHREVREIGGEPVLRVCIKGIQLGNPQSSELSYPCGHCYVFSDRMVVGPGLPEWQPDGLEVSLRRVGTERMDSAHAHAYDGCHFGLALEDDGLRMLCFYTRADRDALDDAIRGRRHR